MRHTHRQTLARCTPLMTAMLALFLAACSDSTPEQDGSHQTENTMLRVRAVNPQPVQEAGRWYLVADIVPEKQSPLAFQTSGRILQRLVEPGMAVAAEQELMILDDSDIQLKLNALQAQLDAAESDQSLARKEWRRIRQLFAKKLVPQDAIDNAQNRLNNVKARVQALQWQVKEIERQLAYTRLQAPDDGVIIQVQADIGQVVAAGQPVLTLQVGHSVEFAVGVPAARLHNLPARAQAEIGNQRLSVRLRYLSPQADPATRTWPARYQLEQPDSLASPLVPGDFARLWFQQPVVESLITLPISAVFSENGQHFVWHLTGTGDTKKAYRVPVQIIKTYPASVWVQTTLQLTDQVVAMGAHLLSEGQTVQVQEQ